jgi:hypothetical protein
MIELFVEKYSVDVDKSFSVMLTLAIDDIKNFSAKNTTFSKTIILPGTNRNNALFGNLFDINAGNNYTSTNHNTGINFNASVSANAIMFADNIQVFKGTFRILEVVIDNGMIEYEAVIFGELGGFVSKMSNNKLTDLDLSAFNHSYGVSSIVASWSATFGSGYYYPLIDYGTYSVLKKDWQRETFRPAVFAKTYIDKIFTASGYSYNCSLFNTARFKSLIVPFNKKLMQRSSAFTFSSEASNQTYDVSTPGTGYVILNRNQLLFNVTANGTNDVFTYTGSPYTGTLTIVVNGSYTKASGGNIIFDLEKNGVSIANQTFGSGTTSGTYSKTLTASVTLNSGDTFDVAYDITPSTTLTINDTSKITLGNGTSVLVPLVAGDTVDMSLMIPANILQKDFISSIIKLFNLYIFEDTSSVDKVLQIMPFVDFYANADSIDWSNKIDRSQPLRIKPMSELNSRYYEFKFKEDGDYYNDLYKKRYNQTYGSYKYDSEFEFANETTSVELIFSGTPLVGYTGIDKIYSTIFKLSGTTEETIDSNIRLLQAKKVSGVSSWSIKSSTGSTLGTYTDYPYAGHLDDPDAPANDINFGVPKELFFALVSGSINVNQFNVYWSSYMAEITDKDSKLLTCKVKLSNTDIFNLDFKKLIWIDGSLFRLNKIIDFNASSEDTCTIELLKVINKIY